MAKAAKIRKHGNDLQSRIANKNKSKETNNQSLWPMGTCATIADVWY